MTGHMFFQESGHNVLWHYLAGVFGYTLLAIGLIYLMYFILKKNPRLLNTPLAQRLKSQPSRPTSISTPRKQAMGKVSQEESQPLVIESQLPLEANKSLYIIRAGQERFLVATGLESTQYIARLVLTETLEKSETPEISAAAESDVDNSVLDMLQAGSNVSEGAASLPNLTPPPQLGAFQDILIRNTAQNQSPPYPALERGQIVSEASAGKNSANSLPDDAILDHLFEKPNGQSRLSGTFKAKLAQTLEQNAAATSSITELRKRMDIL